MTDADKNVEIWNKEISVLVDLTQKEEARLGTRLNISCEDQAEPWMWGTDASISGMEYDNGADYIVVLDDGSLVKWVNEERAYEVITNEELAELKEQS